MIVYSRAQVRDALYAIEMYLAENYSRLLTIEYDSLYHKDSTRHEQEFYQRLAAMCETEEGVANAAGFLSVGNYTKPITREWIEANARN